MTDFGAVKPRKRLITYGKNVKRIQRDIPGVGTFNESPVLSPTTIPLSPKPPFQPLSTDEPDSDSSSLVAGESLHNGFPSELVYTNIKPGVNQETFGHPRTPAGDDGREHRINTGIYDVPTSDEDDAMSYRGSSKKRRRLSLSTSRASSITPVESNPRFHQTLEVGGLEQPPGSIPKLPGRRKNVHKDSPPVSKTLPKPLGSTNRPLKEESSRKMKNSAPSARSRSKVGKDVRQTASRVSKVPKRDISRPERGFSAKQQDEPKRTTPPPTRSKVWGTSSQHTKQAALMNELLEDAAPELSPSRLRLKDLTIRDDHARSITLHSAPDQQYSQPAKKGSRTGLRPPRRRLIDALSREHSTASSPASDAESVEDHDLDSVPEVSMEEAGESPRKKPLSVPPPALSRQGSDEFPSQGSSQTSGPIITYAKQRSYLSEAILEEADLLSDLPDPSDNRQRARGLGKAPSSQVSLPYIFETGDDDEMAATSSGGLRSIHELRQAGGNARLLADFESIIEDVDDPSPGATGRRRGGLMELCTKLMDSNFTRQILDNAMLSRLISSMRTSGDTVTDFLVASVMALFLSTGSMTLVDIRSCARLLLKTIPSLLAEGRDLGVVARERRYNMSKASKTMLVEIQASLKRSRIFSSDLPHGLSPQMMGLRSIDLAVRRLREMGDLADPLPNPVVEQLIDILILRSSQFEEKRSDDAFLAIHSSISVLESYSISIGSLSVEEGDVVRKLSGIAPTLVVAAEGHGKYAQIQMLALRLVLNVTNNNPLLCEFLAIPDLIHTTFGLVSRNFTIVCQDILDGKESSMLDTVLLALGSLINFTEWSSNARKLMAELDSGSGTLIDELLRLFLGQVDGVTQADSVAETNSLVPFGYLSVLLCTICLDNTNRLRVRESLSEGTLEALLSTVEYFLKVYEKVEEASTSEGELMGGFTGRLQGIVDRLRNAEG